MDSPNGVAGVVTVLDDKACKVKVGDKEFELDRLHGPVLIPPEIIICDKVKVIIVSEAVRHIEKLTKEEEEKMKMAEGSEPKKEVKKIQKRIKADQFFSVYDKGFQQKVYMYKVGANEFKGDTPKKQSP